MVNPKVFLLFGVILFLQNCAVTAQKMQKDSVSIVGKELRWEEGYFDIHFIHTGRGNTSFMIFPDGTTLLFDVGDAKQGKKHPNYPSLLDSTKSTGGQVSGYISHFMPKEELDYALISHFHSDHYGEIKSTAVKSSSGKYKLTGITELGNLMKINKLIDRGYPDYEYPVDRRFKPVLKTKQVSKKEEDSTFINYFDFISYQKKHNQEAERIVIGSNKQIRPLYDSIKFPNFKIKNVKANNTIWTGIGNKTRGLKFDPPFVNQFVYYNENPLSLTLKISYGDFDYYVGGDTSGTDDYPDYDVEAELYSVIGEGDAMTLNHQGIHDPHFPEIVRENLLKSKADVFTMSMGENIRRRDGERIDKIYKSTEGNFVIGVSPKGKTFEIIILNPEDNSSVKEVFGPYISRN